MTVHLLFSTLKNIIVDDDPNIRELVALFLRNDGFDLEKDEDGEIALELLEKIDFDMVVLDIMMHLLLSLLIQGIWSQMKLRYCCLYFRCVICCSWD